jgi:hypothetical protein
MNEPGRQYGNDCLRRLSGAQWVRDTFEGVLTMNKLFFVGAFALAGAAAFAMPAFAQTADNAQTGAAITSQAATSHPQAKQRSVPPVNSRQCIRETGSHIPAPKGQCLPVAGNSYSQQDLQRTGATDLGRALQMLDPSVTLHGH